MAAVAAVGARHVAVVDASEGFLSVRVNTRVSVGYENDREMVWDRFCQSGMGVRRLLWVVWSWWMENTVEESRRQWPCVLLTLTVCFSACMSMSTPSP
jgi:hypothetical protein